MTLRVTVLTGGSTPERDVALAGAVHVVAALRERGHVVQVVDTTSGPLTRAEEVERLVSSVSRTPPPRQTLVDLASRELGPRLLELPAIRDADVVFLVLHGNQGEGGALQAMLEAGGVTYTGSNHLGSALAMDKDLAKRIMRYGEIPTPDWVLWPADEPDIERLGFPMVVKPSKVGSTVGLSIVRAASDLPAAVAAAAEFDDEVILEQFVLGQELTVGILGDRALAVGEIVPSNEVFDYECKYTPGKCEEIFPARIVKPLEERVRATAWKVHRALKLTGFSRVDFRVSEKGTPFCLEANTLPGFTGTSLLPQSAAAAGVSFGELCETICHLALGPDTVGNNP